MRHLIICFVAGVLATTVHAEATFKEAYQAYQDAVAKGQFRIAARHAETAYELGEKRFEANSPTLAALSLNHGNALLAVRSLEAERVLDRTLRMYERIHGKKAAELIDPLISLGHAENHLGSRSFKRGRYDRALEIAEDAFGEQDDIVIRLNLDVGSRLTQQGYREGRSYLRTAVNMTEEKHGLDKEAAIQPLFWMGKYHLANKSYKRAEGHFTNVAAIFDSIEGGNKVELALTNRAFLVEALESQGKSEEATQHCRLIGQARAWQPNQEQTPIYQRMPKFPRTAVMRGIEGRVVLEYAVSPDGFVVDPEIIEVEGTNVFSEYTLAAFREWRFAPKVVGGNPVKSERLRRAITYEIVKNQNVSRGSTLSRFD